MKRRGDQGLDPMAPRRSPARSSGSCGGRLVLTRWQIHVSPFPLSLLGLFIYSSNVGVFGVELRSSSSCSSRSDSFVGFPSICRGGRCSSPCLSHSFFLKFGVFRSCWRLVGSADAPRRCRPGARRKPEGMRVPIGPRSHGVPRDQSGDGSGRVRRLVVGSASATRPPSGRASRPSFSQVNRGRNPRRSPAGSVAVARPASSDPEPAGAARTAARAAGRRPVEGARAGTPCSPATAASGRGRGR